MANKFPAIFKNKDFVERRVHCYCQEINEHAIIFLIKLILIIILLQKNLLEDLLLWS